MGIATQTQFHVLAVDDSVIDRKLIERLFKISSYHVTTVDSGRKALEFLGLMEDAIMNKNSNPPPCVPSALPQVVEVNLVITDYCMPGMTGYDLLKKIKESSSLKDIPVVIMSSENVPSRISRCLEQGAEEFLLKPVQLSDVNKLKPHLLKGKPREETQFHDQEAELKEELVELLSPRAAEKQSAQQTNSKRKTMDDIPSERTRARYNDADINCVRIL